MANGTFFANAARPDDTGNGLSEGAAKKTLGALFALGTDGGNTYYIKSGTNYVVTAGITPGPPAGDQTDGHNIIEGYTTAPGAMDGRPTITTATDSTPLFVFMNNGISCRHLRFTNTASTRYHGVIPNQGSMSADFHDCYFDGFVNALHGEYGSNYVWISLAVVNCEFRNCTVGVFNGGGTVLLNNYFYNCEVGWKRGYYNSPGAGIHATRCVFNGNGRASSIGLSGNLDWTEIRNCVFYNLAANGFEIGALQLYTQLVVENNIFDTLGGDGVELAVGLDKRTIRNNAFRSITGSNYVNCATLGGDVALSGNPFVDPSNHNFALNNTAGAGASCRAAAYPGAALFGTGYLDIGALQHQDAGGGAAPSRTNYLVGI